MTTIKPYNNTELGRLPVGDCFMYKGILYQKTDMIPPGNPNKSVCVTVGTGVTQLFGIHEQVLPVDVEVTIV